MAIPTHLCIVYDCFHNNIVKGSRLYYRDIKIITVIIRIMKTFES